MTKTEAIRLFGETKDLAAALDISRQAIYQWPEELPQDQEDRVIGAALRSGLDVSHLRQRSAQETKQVASQ